MRLVCWNIAGRLRRLSEQAARVTALTPDVVCLQEVIARAAPGWIAALADAGLVHAHVGAPGAESPERPISVLTAARGRLTPIELPNTPWPERVLATRVELDGGEAVEVVNVHSPISPKPNLVKVRTHEAVSAHLARGSGPRLVCGDLNTPRKEHPDGRVWTFARDRYGRLRPERGERWDAAELALIKGLEPAGFRDAFRELHGPDVKELSWEWPQWGGGYRLDHLIVSAEIEPLAVLYGHAWRREGLSDHSALVAELRVPAADA